MKTLSHCPLAGRRNALRTLPLAAVAALLGLSLGACQHRAAYLDNTTYDRHIPRADGFLFETDRRFVVMQLTESRMEGVADDDSAVLYLSVPFSTREGLDVGHPAIAVGYLEVAAVFSDMFVRKDELSSIRTYRKSDSKLKWSPDTAELLQLSREHARTPDPALMRELGVGQRLEILDYAELATGDEGSLEIAEADREHSSTD